MIYCSILDKNVIYWYLIDMYLFVVYGILFGVYMKGHMGEKDVNFTRLSREVIELCYGSGQNDMMLRDEGIISGLGIIEYGECLIV